MSPASFPSSTGSARSLPRLLLLFAVSVLAQIFFIVLTVSSFQDYRSRTYSDLMNANAAMTAQKLTVVAQLGRKVENYRAAVQDLYDLKINSGSSDAFIVNAAGEIISGQSAFGITEIDPQAISSDSISLQGRPYRVQPYFDNQGAVQGWVVVCAEEPARLQQASALPSSFYILCAAASLCSLCFFFAAFRLASRLQGSALRQKFITVMLPFLLAQLLTAGAAAPHLFSLAADYGSSLEQSICISLGQQFKEVRAHDISLADISGYERYFEALKQNLEAAGAIAVSSASGEVIAGDQEAPAGSDLPIFSDSRLLGYVNVAASAEVILAFGVDMALKLLTLFIVSSVLAFELSSLLSLEFHRRASGEKRIVYEPELIRPLSFLNIFALYLPITIVPVRMADFASSFPGMPLELVQSLSVCTEMISVALCSFYILLSRSYPGRWRVLGRGSLTLLIAAALTAAAAPNGWIYLLSRMIYGLGYGALLGYCQLFAVASSSADNRGRTMSALSAGLYSGVLCSAAAGGIIADSLGYSAVFLVSAGLFCLNLLLFYYINAHRRLPAAESTGGEKKASAAQIAAMLRDRRILSMLIFEALPYSIIGIGFFNYLLPVSFAEHHLGASMLGQLNFVYAFIIILFSPLTGRLIDRLQQRSWIVLALSLTASALVPLLFNLPNFIAAAFLVMVMLGISASINEGGQPAYLSKIAGSAQAETAVLLLDSVLRIGQTCGPLIMALLITLPTGSAFTLLSGCIIAGALIFALLQAGTKRRLAVVT